MPRLLRDILYGYSSLTIFGAPLKLQLPSPAEALAGDWRRVGNYIRTAMRKFGSPP